MPVSYARKKLKKKAQSRKEIIDYAECGKPVISRSLRAKGQILKRACKNSLLKFNILCFPNSTGLKPFGKVQIDSIAHDQDVIRNGGRVCKAEPRAFGKALALDTPIPTPTGWTMMGEVRVGDTVFDGEGNPTKVAFATDIQLGRQCYSVRFSDGAEIIADADHNWLARDRFYRKGATAKVYSTKQMIGREIITTRRGVVEKRYSVDVNGPLQCHEKRFIVDPYVLGCWLGDGDSSGSRLTCHADDVSHYQKEFAKSGESFDVRHDRRNPAVCTGVIGRGSKISMLKYRRRVQAETLIAAGYETRTIAKACDVGRTDVCRLRKSKQRRPCLNYRLRELGVRGKKHIPSAYLRASVVQRLSLLQGLMDTDGDVSKLGHCSLTTVLPTLHRQYCELLSSLGIKHNTDRHNGSFRISFTAYADFPVFRLQRKLCRLKQRNAVRTPSQSKRIVSITPVVSVPVRCIQVASACHTFLAGEKMTVTHNTSRTCNAALWAVLFNYRRMIPVFSASMDKSKTQIMERWKAELLGNELLFAMFPNLIWAFRKLGNKAQAAASQTWNGELTHIKWTVDRIVFPTIPGEPSSGNILVALPLGSARGATHTTTSGTILRPDLLIFDDVQKDEDADNQTTVLKMSDLIDHTAMMLGGHAFTMSAIMNCTVRKIEDLSETYLSKPGWRHVRYKMLTQPATREKELWLGEYANIRRNYDPESPTDQRRAHREALAFYLKHRKAMDDGACVTWDWAYAWADGDPVEVSAIQHAYNILIDLGEDVFASECQNEPIRDSGGLTILTPNQMAAKQSGCVQNSVPAECSTLTAFCDVHEQIHYWQVWAWEPNFTGYLIDYGTFPDQKRRMFDHDRLTVRLDRVFPNRDTPATIYAGLEALIHGTETYQGLLRREWIKTNGTPIKISVMGIDANGAQKSTVMQFIRNCQVGAILYPSFGQPITAAKPPISRWRRENRKPAIEEWIDRRETPGDPTGILFDANHWKTQFHRRIALPVGSQGAIYFYKVDDPAKHRLLASHCFAERPKEAIYGSRVVYEFPERFKGDNHYFDCAVGNLVAASKSGISSIALPPKRKRINLAELQRQRWARQGRL